MLLLSVSIPIKRTSGNILISFKIDIRIKRNGIVLTHVKGIPSHIDLLKLLKDFKKEFCCNGCIIEERTIIELHGDRRERVSIFFGREWIM